MDPPRKKVDKMFKEIDHTIWGAPCAKVLWRIEELSLQRRYQVGLPPKRFTDHRIDLKPDSEPPPQRLRQG